MCGNIPTYGLMNGFDCTIKPKRTCKTGVQFSLSPPYGYRLMDKSLVYETRE